ncbi:hypothetical protein ACX9Q3_002220 [Klebsiella oxytoca]|nr:MULTISPECIES: hypothetical protein [Enterobacteriaceae]EDF6232813.1 hypothetical protein [Salmonella enterica subsp. enterica serovar Senftenberg]EIY9028163.1 hypothetical protein [Salmonella enterica]ELO5147011.1 hypothetical protein [Citrobacter freundii]MDE1513108.1 hypothetical protein [Serratia nevei]HBR1132811.1 hypothetical protein [Klebsiella quasipneumoniae subsp. similipneumoniae]HCM5085264.1 hypothetical protein [Klebsiella aerogenes]HDU3840782.1 hypothetical protein [Klebsiell
MKPYFAEPPCALLMPAYKIPPLLNDGSLKEAVRLELERKYGTRMTLEAVCTELGVTKNAIVHKIGNSKFQHHLIFRKLFHSRVFPGKNTAFWTDKIAKILIEGNTNGL